MEVERTRTRKKKKAKSKAKTVSEGEDEQKQLETNTNVEPEVTPVKPEVTPEPLLTVEPAETIKLEVTHEPLLTVEPSETVKPEVTAEPVLTVEPNVTLKSEVTTEPEVTIGVEDDIEPKYTDVPTVPSHTPSLESEKRVHSPPIATQGTLVSTQGVDCVNSVSSQEREEQRSLITEEDQTAVLGNISGVCTVTEVTPVVVTTVKPTAPILAPVETAVLYPNVQEVCCFEDLTPWTEEELCRLYKNPQLDALDKFVDNFLKQAKRETDEFYELLVSYLKARLSLTVTQKQLEGFQSEYDHLKDHIWSVETHTITSSGKCSDRNNVSSSYSYKVANLSHENLNQLSTKLSKIRGMLQEELCMQSYTCQVARLHIEHYVFNLIGSTGVLAQLPNDAPPTCHVHTHDPSNLSSETARLKDCVSVLFMFERRPAQDQQFTQDCRRWLDSLLSGLLRLATLLDHQFILHHLLRCPPGVSEWATMYLQIPSPSTTPSSPHCFSRQRNWDPYGVGVGLGLHSDWGGPLLDHFVTQLAGLVLPVRDREEFLVCLGVKKPNTARSESTEKENWQFVTESLECEGEEDQMLLSEADLIAFYDQFSFNAMFRYILNISENDDYCVERIDPDNLLRLLAFCTCLVQLLGNAFSTFRKTKYREFVKRVGRTIRHAVHFVSDHWLSFKSILDSSPEKKRVVAHMIPRLQVEYDEFVVRSARWLLSAHKLGAWQFLADLPYTLLSMKVLLRIFYMLYSNQTEEKDSSVPKSAYELEALLKESALHSQFIEQLMTTLTSETVFLLTTFSNMARCRLWSDGEEIVFIKLMTSFLFEITQVADFAREVYAKTGASLLETIATVHPPIMTQIMDRAKVTVGSAQETHINLFKELPIHLWQPTPDDTSTLRDWLISYPIDSAENQISRTILINLNWSSFNPNNPSELALSPMYHRETAVLLVEALSTHLANHPGGHEFDITLAESSGKKGIIQSLAFWGGTLTKEQELLQSWAWKVVLMLKIHPSQLDFEQYREKADWTEVTYMGVRWGELSKEMDMVDVHRSVRSGGLLASYVALCTSLCGVSLDVFQTEGLPLLQRLGESGYYIPCLRAFSNIFPQLVSNRRVLVHDERFLNVVHLIAAADSLNASMFTFSKPDNIVLNSMSALLQSQFSRYKGQNLVEFWLDILTAQTNWYREDCILHLLNALSRAAIKPPQLHKFLQARYLEIYKEKEPLQNKKGGLFSTLSNIAGKGAPPFTFTAQYNNLDHPWLTFDLLWAETECEHDLWLQLIRELHTHKKMSLDAALRKACESLHLHSTNYPAYHLALFRWAQFALSLPLESPVLPLVWQRFFSLYLHRVVVERSGAPLRESFGFKILSYQSGLGKKLKIQILTLMKFYKEKLQDFMQSSPSSETENEMKVFYERTADLYSKLKCWVEEPLLHEGELILSSLPTNYDIPRLQEIFEPQITHLWLDCVPLFVLEEEGDKLVQEWKKLEAFQKTLSSVPENTPVSSESAVTRILNRLSRRSEPVPPPPLTVLQNPLPPVPPSCFLSATELKEHLREDLLFIQGQARIFQPKQSILATLDAEFVHLLPQLNKNVSKQFHVSQPCRKKSKNHYCTGPATIIFKFDEMVVDGAVEMQIYQNRNFYSEAVQELSVPVAFQLCCAVVSIEQIVAELSRIIENGSPGNREKALDAAIGLFYSITDYITMETRQYPPTCQFFTSALSILGQQFLPNMPNQSLQVLQLIKDRPALADLLVPLYDPNLSLDHFTSQYKEVVEQSEDQSKLAVVFSLITKFSVSDWLIHSSPDQRTCRELLEVVFRGMCFCGVDPSEDEVAMLFEVYRKHFCMILRYHVSALLPTATTLLLEGIDSSTISPVLWTDVIGVTRLNDETEPLPQTRLSLQEIQNLIQTLSYHFSTKQLAVDTLYCSYGSYSRNIATFFKFVVQCLLTRWSELINNGNSHVESGVKDCWEASLALFGPWILPSATPTDGEHRRSYPWLHDQVDDAHFVLSSFVGALNSFKFVLPMDRIVAIVWDFYLHCVAVDNQSLYILEVYHSEFAQLLWQHFIPQIIDLESMISLQSRTTQPLLFSFCCYIATKIDWITVMSLCSEAQSEGSGGQLMGIFHSLVLKLMVMVSQDPNVMTDVSSLPDLLDRASKLQWNYLDAKSLKEACDWLNSNCSAKDILMKGSTLSLALSLLKEAAEFPFSTDKQRNPDHSQKRCFYIRLLTEVISACTHQRSLSKQDVYSPIRDMFDTISSLALYESGSQDQIIQLLEDILNLLNIADPSNDALQTIIAVFQDILTQAPNMHLIAIATIKAALRTIVAVEHMVEIVETAIMVHFTSIPTVENPEKEWGILCSAMTVPEGIAAQFVSECVQKNLFFSLFGLSLNELNATGDKRQEIDLMVRMTQWCTRMKPEPSQEAKALLLWWKTLQLMLRQIRYIGKVAVVGPHMTEFAQSLCRFGEDKASEGLLGVIGLGKKSVYSIRLRLLARGLGCFLHSQLPHDKDHRPQIRMTPNAPGSIKDSTPSGGCQPTKVAEQNFKALQSLAANKTYQSLKDQIAYVVDFTVNPTHNVMSSLDLFVYLSQAVFPTESACYLSILSNKI